MLVFVFCFWVFRGIVKGADFFRVELCDAG